MADQTQIDELTRKMAEERARLLDVLERLDEADAATPTTGEGEWDTKQQMSHLCEMETAYRAWVARALQEDGADLDGVRGEPPAIPLEQANEHSVGEHAGEMRRQRAKTLALIEALRPEDFERRAAQRMFGSLTVMQWLRSYYRHDRMHYDQVRGVEPEYKPRYAGGKEPDQRRA
jgi:DinB superfamily